MGVIRGYGRLIVAIRASVEAEMMWVEAVMRMLYAIEDDGEEDIGLTQMVLSAQYARHCNERMN